MHFLRLRQIFIEINKVLKGLLLFVEHTVTVSDLFSTQNIWSIFRLPCSNSLNQEESRSAGSGAVVTADTLEKWKEGILCELKQEIDKAKNDIIEVLRSELRLQRR